jgi:hypothetical protein
VVIPSTALELPRRVLRDAQEETGVWRVRCSLAYERGWFLSNTLNLHLTCFSNSETNAIIEFEHRAEDSVCALYCCRVWTFQDAKASTLRSLAAADTSDNICLLRFPPA